MIQISHHVGAAYEMLPIPRSPVKRLPEVADSILCTAVILMSSLAPSFFVGSILGSDSDSLLPSLSWFWPSVTCENGVIAT